MFLVVDGVMVFSQGSLRIVCDFPGEKYKKLQALINMYVFLNQTSQVYSLQFKVPVSVLYLVLLLIFVYRSF